MAFTTIFIVEHFSSFSIINSKTTLIEQTTPFGTKIINDTGAVPCVFTKIRLESYTDKVPFYFNAVLKDFRFLVIFWIIYFFISYVFRKQNKLF